VPAVPATAAVVAQREAVSVGYGKSGHVLQFFTADHNGIALFMIVFFQICGIGLGIEVDRWCASNLLVAQRCVVDIVTNQMSEFLRVTSLNAYNNLIFLIRIHTRVRLLFKFNLLFYR
jgi:hypothetical protein